MTAADSAHPCGLPRPPAAALRWPEPATFLPKVPLTAADNVLLDQLPHGERRRLLAHCEPVPLLFADLLCTAGSPTAHAYFPRVGFVSLLARTDGDSQLEVGMVGCEGMVGVQLALGVGTAPLDAQVQGAGSAWRLTRGDFDAHLAASPALRTSMGRYTHRLMCEMAASAACLRFHLVGQRLARWLLMSQDRARADRFRVTHVFLASMLGVRRVGITAAAAALQRRGLIAYVRGDLTVLDRAGLEAAACSCYAADRLRADGLNAQPA